MAERGKELEIKKAQASLDTESMRNRPIFIPQTKHINWVFC